jgi:hypothetical protein
MRAKVRGASSRECKGMFKICDMFTSSQMILTYVFFYNDLRLFWPASLKNPEAHQVAEDYVEFASNMMLSSWTRSSAFGGNGPGSMAAASAAAPAPSASAGAAKTTATIAFGCQPPPAASSTKNSSNSSHGRSSSTTTTTAATTTAVTTNGHDRLHYYPLETISALSYLKSPMRRPMVLERWSPYEIAIFEATLAQYGKDFLQVQKELASISSNHQHSVSNNGNANTSNGKTDTSAQDTASSSLQYQYCNKTTKDVVEFYYIWKKTSHYQRWKATYVAPHQDDDDDDDDDSDDEYNDKNKKITEPIVKPKRKYTRRIQPAASATTGEGGSSNSNNKQA